MPSQQPLTPTELNLFRRSPASEQMYLFLQLYEQDPQTAIEVRAASEATIPAASLSGITKTQLAQLMGVRTEQIDVMARNGMPVERIGREDGKAGRQQRATYNLAEVLAWLVSQKRRKVDSDSEKTQEANYEYRLEKLRLLRMERLTKERQLLSAEQVQGCLSAFASILRKAGERLQSISMEAASVLFEAIDDGERLVAEMNAEFEARGGVSQMVDDAVEEAEIEKEKTQPKRRATKKK